MSEHLSKQENVAGALLKPINPAVSVILGFYTVLWGLWIAAPWWSVFPRAPLYSVMASIAPEWAWGLFAIFCGSMMILGAIDRSYSTFTRGALIIGFHWTIIAICYFLGDWQSTGGITSLTFALYAAFLYLNIRVNYRGKKKIEGILP